jgi:predicted short-subunit dehydrogenase-like oxidoreductase (DUF2520 family)
MDIVLIGSGNTASVLGGKMKEAGHRILQVLSRNVGHAALLAGKLGSDHTDKWNNLSLRGDIYLLAISDDAINNMDKEFNLDKKLIVHTAGSVPMDVLKVHSRNYGVLYPLQSLRKEIPSVKDIPFLIQANTNESLTLILDLALSISSVVVQTNDAARINLHLAAVVVNNFSNHLFALAEEFCKKENIRFELLIPIINETIERLGKFSPSQLQTGPAIRRDAATIKKHLEMLEKYPSLKILYEEFSRSIEERT